MLRADLPLVIRADAFEGLGTGHVMRCVALGQAWRSMFGPVHFLTHVTYPFVRDLLTAEGMDIIDIAPSLPEKVELRMVRDVLARAPHAPVVVDGYHLSLKPYASMEKEGHPWLVVDDYMHRPDYPSSLVLNQNVGAERLSYGSEGCRILAGSRYTLLRREFFRVERAERPEGPVRNVLVTMGGEDPSNVTCMVLRALQRVRAEMEVLVIAGAANRHLAEIERLSRNSGNSIRVEQSVRDMPTVLQWADFAISAGGSTMWELCYFGVPSMVVGIAENQRLVVDGVVESGAAVLGGWCPGLDEQELPVLLERVLPDARKRAEMSRCGRALIDGRGAYRVCGALCSADLRLRLARKDDAGLYFEWVNERAVRESAFNTEPIGFEEHQKWFSRRLHDDDCLLFVAELANGHPVGQIRFSLEEGNAVVDVSVDKSCRGIGLGRAVIGMGVRELEKRFPQCAPLAVVKTSNEASLKAFRGSGMKESTVTTMVNGEPCKGFSLAAQRKEKRGE